MTIKSLPSSDAALAAAIDIGSNAMRLRICGLDGHGELKTIHYHREAVRLGKDAFTTGYLSKETMADAEHAFQSFQKIISQYHVNMTRAVATSALRDTKNASSLIKRIRQKTDIRIEIISGDEEGRLIHTAIHKKIPDVDTKVALLIDIGGGSVEVTLSQNGEITSLESYNAGTVRLIERFRESKEKYNFKLLSEHIDSLQQKVKKQIAGKHIDICIGTGGNIECLGELGSSLLNTPSSDELSYDNLKSLCEKLTKLSYSERTQQLQLRPDRADVIIPASLILKSIMKLANPAPLKIPKVGLADGILIDLLYNDATNTVSHEHQALAWAATLAKKFHADLHHAEYVRSLSCKIFEQLDVANDFHQKDCTLLQIAALLHEIGKAVRIAGHQRHAHYLINASPIIGLTMDEKKLVASIVRYHRKRLPDETHAPFCQHSKEEQQRLLKLTAILRLAIALNKEKKYDINHIQCHHSKSSVELCILDQGIHHLGLWTAKKQRPWFEAAFNKKLCISTAD